MNCTLYSHHNNGLMTRSLEKLLEDAHLCGELKLGGRKLKEFPITNKYDLSDTTIADLSKNCFTHFPSQVIHFWSLEYLNLYHNAIRSIPNSVTSLQSLVHLDLSRNHLKYIPSVLCQLPLEVLLLSNNKLSQLPTEIGFCKTLIELDVSCNVLTNLPPQLGQLSSLKCLNAQNNLIIELPLELTYIKLARLNVSLNRIASLPVELRLMTNLECLEVANNPLISPPTSICIKGRIHIFKWLEIKSIKDGRHRGSSWKFNSLKSYSQSIEDNLTLSETTTALHSSDEGVNGSMEYLYKSERKYKELNGYNNTSPEFIRVGKNIDSTIPINNTSLMLNDKPIHHTQSYREYKEFLKQQRTQESIYKNKTKTTDNNFDQKDISPYVKPTTPEIITTPVNNLSLQVPLNSSPSIWSKNNTQATKNKLQFTMKREYERAKEEAELLKQLRHTIESRLKMSLPSELSSALSDGVVLCYLANHVKPRSVGSIHVPSPAVPKLTMARCRRNVDNFLEACRKIGVKEKLICCAVDILEGKGIVQLAITVGELIKFHTPKSPVQIVNVPSLLNI
ncbi:Leucine-rich repeat,Leucine-rich repeat domain, L domain-like,Leucine-rich repeat, typical [Cinara cedri]|uniref:Leucine-rich repeat,Leucine-rich repeat domain, L domain-like,Leucine-rich repeat, typical n=1 Tax=Cinara cedri TaxID=506608 RepID=A0A5E4NGW7_9HEMI|nr:Leucine-rich repeat,Leucine-rich repeat domain, L domain-like,Leucine-rich repeat, typical [Cinara cedri]